MAEHQFPPTRHGLTRKFICGLDVYLTVNLKPDGEPGEIFIKLGKQGSTLSGLMQAFAITVSAALQRGVPWPALCEKYCRTRFEPHDHRYSSLVDAIAKNIDDMLAQLREQRQRNQLTFEFAARESGEDK